jgi:long-chain acyl-CoA synthetase
MVRHTNHVTVEPSGGDVTVDGARALARLAKSAELALGGVDLSLPQYRVLIFLSEHDAAAASALASRLDVTRPTITALVDGLVARGLVERRAAQGDRRRVEHHLTAAGEAILDAGDAAIIDRLHALAAHLDPADGEQAASGLTTWGDALGRARTAYLDDTGAALGAVAPR